MFDLSAFIDFFFLFFSHRDASITEDDHEWVQSFQTGSLAVPNKACKLTTRKGYQLLNVSASKSRECQHARSVYWVNFLAIKVKLLDFVD